MSDVKVTVVIATTAQKSRFTQIIRCVQSIRNSSVAPIQIVTIVNGQKFDDDVVHWLKSQADIRYKYVELPSLPNALLEGRKLVETEYFSTLDDDDEYLPGGTDQKLAVLLESPDIDLVVTNTYWRCEGEQQLNYSNMSKVAADPLISLFRENWLNSGNALYRSASIGVAHFTDGSPFAEWTWLAFKISIEGKVVGVLESPTNRVHVTAGSLSQSNDYFDAWLPFYDSLIKCGPPKKVVQLILQRISATWHDHSVRAMERRKWLDALKCHYKSLMLPGGLRYLSYSRRLLTYWLPPR